MDILLLNPIVLEIGQSSAIGEAKEPSVPEKH
jgi:hypothetical protein